eukprot:5772113-Prymnesium_polylepis.2
MLGSAAAAAAAAASLTATPTYSQPYSQFFQSSISPRMPSLSDGKCNAALAACSAATSRRRRQLCSPRL